MFASGYGERRDHAGNKGCRGLGRDRRGLGQRFLLLALLIALPGAVLPANAAASRIPELVSVGPGGADISDIPFMEGVSNDGRRVWLRVGEPLVPEDADGLCPRGYDYWTGEEFPPTPCYDVYERDRLARTTNFVSTFPGANGTYDAYFAGATPNGTHVYFETREPLVAEDTDSCPGEYDEQSDPPGCVDVYERFNGTTRLISTGAGTENLNRDAGFREVTPAGDRVFFDFGSKSYIRAQTDTIPLLGNFAGGSEDRSQVMIATRTNLLPEDHDTCTIQFGHPELGGCLDVYKQNPNTGALEFVSTGPLDNQNYYAASSWDVSSDGRYVFFTTAEPLVNEDTDTDTDPFCKAHDGWGEVYCVDIYRRDTLTDTTTLISIGPVTTGRDGHGPSDFVDFYHATPDASRVVFSTRDPLVPEDRGDGYDVYEWVDGTTKLVSNGVGIDPTGEATSWTRGAAVSRDGRTIVFATQARLLPSDTDGEWDFYVRSHDVLKQISIGPTGGNGSSPSYSNYVPGFKDFEKRYFFESPERLIPEDTDSSWDIYEWQDGRLSLVLPGDASGFITGSTPDGRHIFVGTTAPLTSEDTDSRYDIYALTANDPPDCSGVRPNSNTIWPPTGKFTGIELSRATDPDGDAVAMSITGVTQDEDVGPTADAQPAANSAAVRLRAERDPKGNGRVYRIAFKASDGTDNCTEVVKVAVPHDQGRPAIDSAPPSYNSFGG